MEENGHIDQIAIHIANYERENRRRPAIVMVSPQIWYEIHKHIDKFPISWIEPKNVINGKEKIFGIRLVCSNQCEGVEVF